MCPIREYIVGLRAPVPSFLQCYLASLNFLAQSVVCSIFLAIEVLTLIFQVLASMDILIAVSKDFSYIELQ